MTLKQQIEFLRTECYQDLNTWEKEFIVDVYDHVQDTEEELTSRQKEKIREIWEGVGL